MASEKAISERIARLCKKRGAWSLKVHASRGTRRGVPDRLICYRGHFLAVEEKGPTGKATPLQEYEIEQIQAAGGIAIVADTVEAVEREMNRIDVAIEQ